MVEIDVECIVDVSIIDNFPANRTGRVSTSENLLEHV